MALRKRERATVRNPAADNTDGAITAGNPTGTRILGAQVAKPLVIVESPAKAKTIAGYLGNDYKVKASVGHIRDLPGSKDEVPDEKKETHGRLAGIDPDHHFDAVYVVHGNKKKVVAELKRR